MNIMRAFDFPNSKAKTLEYLKPLLKLAVVPELMYFSVKEWKETKNSILDNIANKFNNKSLVIRSSSLNEDTASTSNAGAFESVLGISATNIMDLNSAIEKVIGSYKESLSDKDLVLIQEMISEISASGVITTHVIETGAAYYVLNYDDESGRTDTITGGTKTAKTVYVQRETPYSMIKSERIIKWLKMIKEVESLCNNCALDIEFAHAKSGQIYLFQARRIAVESSWNKIVSNQIQRSQRFIREFINEYSKLKGSSYGYKTIFGQMPDWNPAEIIGARPRQLSISLYEYLITEEIWSKSRSMMGYQNQKGNSLMVQIGNACYIDVRQSFNSFLPVDLDAKISSKLMDGWINRLDEHPEFHDKVEFEIAQTAKNFTFKSDFENRYSGIIDAEQFLSFDHAVSKLTSNAILGNCNGSLNYALETINALMASQKISNKESFNCDLDILWEAKNKLNRCREMGTLPFAIIARHAFIAEDLLRSAVKRNAISQSRLEEFRRSIWTISRDLSKDFTSVISGNLSNDLFLNKYGHLRPGTYDIRSLRYDQNKTIFDSTIKSQGNDFHLNFQLSNNEQNNLNELLKEGGLSMISAVHLFDYAQKSIIGREFAKYIFTKDLSDSLELIANWGQKYGLTREHLSYVHLRDLFDLIHKPALNEIADKLYETSQKNKAEYESYQLIHLSYIIRGDTDTYVIPIHRSMANFITNKSIEGKCELLNSIQQNIPNLNGKIICIESADPGFDWIFTRNIAGLITKFGGTNSHMAIRCAEYGLPAAIGCGEHLFSQLKNEQKIEINCAEKIIRLVHG